MAVETSGYTIGATLASLSRTANTGTTGQSNEGANGGIVPNNIGDGTFVLERHLRSVTSGVGSSNAPEQHLTPVSPNVDRSMRLPIAAIGSILVGLVHVAIPDDSREDMSRLLALFGSVGTLAYLGMKEISCPEPLKEGFKTLLIAHSTLETYRLASTYLSTTNFMGVLACVGAGACVKQYANRSD